MSCVNIAGGITVGLGIGNMMISCHLFLQVKAVYCNTWAGCEDMIHFLFEDGG